MQKELMDMKNHIVELHNQILDLSKGLWGLNTKIDQILMEDMGISQPSVEMTHSDENSQYPGQYGNEPERVIPQQPVVIRARSRATPEPPQTPTIVETPETLPPLPPKAPVQPEPKKSNLVERLLGKEADQQEKARKERMKQLEQELKELSKK